MGPREREGADLGCDDDESDNAPDAGGEEGTDATDNGDGKCELDDAESELGGPHAPRRDMGRRRFGLFHY